MTAGLSLGPWIWPIAAVALAGVEVLAPGAFMIWLAAAAAGTAALSWLLRPTWEWQVVHFVLLSVITVLLGRSYLGRRTGERNDLMLNRRVDRMVGSTVTVVEAIVGGRGRVQVADSPWFATGPDTAAGSQVRVLRVEGTTLVVEETR